MKIVKTSSKEFAPIFRDLLVRREKVFDNYSSQAAAEIENFRKRGEDFLIEHANHHDGVELSQKQLWVDPQAIKQSHKVVSTEVRKSIESTKERIERFQADLKLSGIEAQEESGIIWGTIVRPLDRVGIYVPGGSAHHFLNLLLAGVPARLAGVKEIVVATPPKKKFEPLYVGADLLYCAKLLDISKILVCGGPAALAAMAFGTSQAGPVQKILGSGGKLTVTGFQKLSGHVGIGPFCGPAETAFLCDKTARIDFVGSDILGKADRDPEASIFLFHTDEKWIRELVDYLAARIGEIKDAQTRTSISQCVESNFFCFLTKSVSESIERVNELAPGTICLQLKSPNDYVSQIRACGSLLVGPYSPPTALDIIGGAAGLIPTLGAADYSMSLSPSAFLRRFPYIEVSKEALERAQATSVRLAREEGFVSHDQSFQVRLDDKKA